MPILFYVTDLPFCLTSSLRSTIIEKSIIREISLLLICFLCSHPLCSLSVTKLAVALSNFRCNIQGSIICNYAHVKEGCTIKDCQVGANHTVKGINLCALIVPFSFLSKNLLLAKHP